VTRVAVLSDVHANLHALRAVLASLEGEGVDRFLVAGDLVGYGAHPNECVELLERLPAVAVAGNHDLVATGRAELARCGHLARQTLDWTMGELTEASRTYLLELPLIREEGSGKVVMTHGSLTDPFEYVRSAEQAATQLQHLAAGHPEARILVLGHTHLPMAYRSSGAMFDVRSTSIRMARDERYVLNPGSVGQSRDRAPTASFLLLGLETGEASFRRIPYDIEGCRAALRERGLPVEGCHRRPVSPLLHHRIGRRVRRLGAGRFR
jgi:predicted phosphodiesterase